MVMAFSLGRFCAATRENRVSGLSAARVYTLWKLRGGMADKCFLSGSVLQNWFEYVAGVIVSLGGYFCLSRVATTLFPPVTRIISSAG